MKHIETVLIAGAGAVGLTVADTFHRYDANCVALLAAGERLERYHNEGLKINGQKFDFVLADPVSAAKSSTVSAFDLIIVACKNHHLEQIIADIKPFVGEETLILSLLNGISSEEALGNAFGRERLPLAMILGTDAQHQNGETSFTQRGVVNFGDADGRETGRDLYIAELFTRTGLPFEYRKSDMKRELWYKFMMNVGANQVSALLALPYGPFKRNSPRAIPEAQELLESAMKEVIPIANAEGIDLSAADIERWYTTVEKLSDEGYTSMCQDVLARRKTEVELFSLAVKEYGKKHSIPTPVNDTLYLAIRAIETANSALRGN